MFDNVISSQIPIFLYKRFFKNKHLNVMDIFLSILYMIGGLILVVVIIIFLFRLFSWLTIKSGLFVEDKYYPLNRDYYDCYLILCGTTKEQVVQVYLDFVYNYQIEDYKYSVFITECRNSVIVKIEDEFRFIFFEMLTHWFSDKVVSYGVDYTLAYGKNNIKMKDSYLAFWNNDDDLIEGVFYDNRAFYVEPTYDVKELGNIVLSVNHNSKYYDLLDTVQNYGLDLDRIDMLEFEEIYLDIHIMDYMCHGGLTEESAF